MLYLTRRSHWMRKHKVGATCPSALFVESVPGTHRHEKKCVDVRRPDALECTT
jgi:hypothetical protein